MIKSPVFLAVILLMSTLVAMGYQAVDLNKVRLNKIYVAGKTPEPIKKQKPAASLPTLMELAKQNLMGKAAGKGSGKTASADAAKVASLKFTLMGTIIKKGGGKSSALIQGGKKETKRYYVGDMIESGVLLNAVAANSIVLKRNGKLETLDYPVNVATDTPSPAPTLPVAPTMRPHPGVLPLAHPEPGGTPAADRLASLRERMKSAHAHPNAQPNPAEQQTGKH